MDLSLSDITINSPKVVEKLKSFLFTISNYRNFKYDMPLQVFIDKDKDFTAVESLDYNIQFTSSAHKLVDTIKSPFPAIQTDFRAFNNFVKLH